MPDCRKGGRLTYLPPEDEREPGVLYQHPLYSLKFYEQLTAIEVRGVRFERVRECEFVIEDNMNETEGMGDVWFRCTACDTRFDYYADDWLLKQNHCPHCGAKAVKR